MEKSLNIILGSHTRITANNRPDVQKVIDALTGMAAADVPTNFSVSVDHTPLKLREGDKGYVEGWDVFREGNRKITLTIEEVASDDYWREKWGV